MRADPTHATAPFQLGPRRTAPTKGGDKKMRLSCPQQSSDLRLATHMHKHIHGVTFRNCTLAIKQN